MAQKAEAISFQNIGPSGVNSKPSSIAVPKPELGSKALVCVRRFADWCKSKGVPFVPAQPATVAAYIIFENREGADFQRIFSTVEAIAQMHDRAGLSNPCATMAVRHELGCIYHIDPPRSWAKVHRPLFASLPIECRHVIENYADLASKAVRKAQNEAADLRRQLKELQQKGTTENG